MPGGPGVSTFYALNGETFITGLYTFFYALRTLLPADVTITIENTGDVLDSTNGDLVDVWAGEAQTPVVGTASGAYAAPVGVLMTWLTATISDSHRLRGRTYMVPVDGSQFGDNGQVAPSPLGYFQTAGDTLVEDGAANWVIWRRPRLAKAADGSRKAVTARDGLIGVVSACTVGSSPAILTSRRD